MRFSKWVLTPASFPVFYIVASCFYAGPYESVLGERAMASVRGLSDSSAKNTSACATRAIVDGETTLYNNCSADFEGKPCIKCSNDRTTKIPNTSGGPGIERMKTALAVCKNYDMQQGVCFEGGCINYMPAGKCLNPNLGNQPPPTPEIWQDQSKDDD